MKILDLLNSLNEGEIKRFKKFISSPYHNENKDVIKLFEDFLVGLIGNHKIQPDVKREFLKKSNWSDAKFRKYCTDTLNLLIDFNSIEYINQNKLKSAITKYNATLNKEWLKQLDYKKSQISKLKEHKQSWTEIELAYYYIFLKSQIDANLFSPEDSLLIYAEIAQVKKEFLKASDMSSNLDLNNLEQANYILEKQYFKALTPLNNNVYRLYKKVNDLFEGKEPQVLLTEIKELLIQVEISTKLKDKILVHCTGYLSTLVNKGNQNIRPEIYKLYKFGIENSILLLQVVDYRNIAYLACASGEFEWALGFVEEYKSELPIEEQESAYSFTKARTLWYAKDWEAVIRTLRNVEYKDMTYNLLARSYILTCYYELDDFDPLDSLIKSFKVYLRRKRNVSKARKESFYNFISALDHLMKASERNDHRRIQKAKDLIQENPSTRNKDWLNEKIEELEAVIKPSKK